MQPFQFLLSMQLIFLLHQMLQNFLKGNMPILKGQVNLSQPWEAVVGKHSHSSQEEQNIVRLHRSSLNLFGWFLIQGFENSRLSVFSLFSFMIMDFKYFSHRVLWNPNPLLEMLQPKLNPLDAASKNLHLLYIKFIKTKSL